MRSKSALTRSGKPHFLPYIKHLAPFNPVLRAYIDLESADDLALFGFMAQVADMVTWGTPGSAYDGTPADCIDLLALEDNRNQWVRNLKVDAFQEERSHYSQNRALTGVYPYYLTREGSYRNAYWTGEKSELRLNIGNPAYVAATTPQVDLVVIGMRDMK